LLGGRVHHGLQRSLVDRLERRRARPRASCDQESNTDQQARVGAHRKFKRHFANDQCCWRTSFPLRWNSCLTMIRRTFAFFRERSFVYSAESYESIGVMAPQNLIAYMSYEIQHRFNPFKEMLPFDAAR